jgi:hypothetical protein
MPCAESKDRAAYSDALPSSNVSETIVGCDAAEAAVGDEHGKATRTIPAAVAAARTTKRVILGCAL